MKKDVVISKLNPSVFNGIAHRGYHSANVAEATENGLKAFQNAIDRQLAIELDVHLTKDGKLIVCHDSQLSRTTGKEGIIEELTLAEIQEGYRLHDGGMIPSFRQVLDLVDEQVPLIVELKVYCKNYKHLAQAVKCELDNIKDTKNFMLISFDPRALICLGKGKFIRSLLVCKSHKWTYSLRFLFESVDLEKVLFSDQKICKYHNKHLVNCWTIESEEEAEKVRPYTDMVTFQHMDYRIIQEKFSRSEEK